MDYTVIKNDFLNESTYIFTHKSGLKIYISPKKGYSKKCAFFATHFGSMDNCFKDDKTNEFKTIPDGVAHFLEHKLFESEDGDAFTKYAATGASANAYTSFTHTAYYFTCTDKLKENLKILTDLMQTPYFTKENVHKEQGIIGQEINMYLDNPSWRVYFNLLEAMYHNCPVRKDIAGSVESISKITDELLYECYNKFYNAHNLVLCISGDVSVKEIAEYVDTLLDRIVIDNVTETKYEEEPKSVLTQYTEQKLSVSMPIFNIGFKDNVSYIEGNDYIKKNLIGKIVLDTLFGRSSKFYDRLYTKGLINDSFDIEYSLEKHYGHSILSGESEDPKAVYEEVFKTIDEYNRSGISDEELSRQLNIAKSSFICQFNNIEETTRAIMEAHFNNYNLYDSPQIFNTVTKTDINNAIKQLKREYSVLSVINTL